MEKLKLCAEYQRHVINELGEIEIHFSISQWQYQRYLEALEKGKRYALEIADFKEKRTERQNRLLWELISKIDRFLNGSSGDVWELYLQLLEMANIKSVDISIEREAVPQLKAIYRAIKYLGQDMTDSTRDIYKCFVGSSKMNKKDFAALIDTVIEYAEECGIETTFYNMELK